ncbi:hypothetical protein K438DRAFT_1931039 [Mycena galopus ATCC 62051]|nr:hypothetical protein K438DRAFT_1931039 [Mycena galopus ATCC 62051]
MENPAEERVQSLREDGMREGKEARARHKRGQYGMESARLRCPTLSAERGAVFAREAAGGDEAGCRCCWDGQSSASHNSTPSSNSTSPSSCASSLHSVREEREEREAKKNGRRTTRRLRDRFPYTLRSAPFRLVPLRFAQLTNIGHRRGDLAGEGAPA